MLSWNRFTLPSSLITAIFFANFPDESGTRS